MTRYRPQPILNNNRWLRFTFAEKGQLERVESVPYDPEAEAISDDWQTLEIDLDQPQVFSGFDFSINQRVCYCWGPANSDNHGTFYRLRYHVLARQPLRRYEIFMQQPGSAWHFYPSGAVTQDDTTSINAHRFQWRFISDDEVPTQTAKCRKQVNGVPILSEHSWSEEYAITVEDLHGRIVSRYQNQHVALPLTKNQQFVVLEAFVSSLQELMQACDTLEIYKLALVCILSGDLTPLEERLTMSEEEEKEGEEVKQEAAQIMQLTAACNAARQLVFHFIPSTINMQTPFDKQSQASVTDVHDFLCHALHSELTRHAESTSTIRQRELPQAYDVIAAGQQFELNATQLLLVGTLINDALATIISSELINTGIKELYLKRAVSPDLVDFYSFLNKLYASHPDLELIKAFKLIHDLCFNKEIFIGEHGRHKILNWSFEWTVAEGIDEQAFQSTVRDIVSHSVREIQRTNSQLVMTQSQQRVDEESRIVDNNDWLMQIEQQSELRENHLVFDEISEQEAMLTGLWSRLSADMDAHREDVDAGQPGSLYQSYFLFRELAAYILNHRDDNGGFIHGWAMPLLVARYDDMVSICQVSGFESHLIERYTLGTLAQLLDHVGEVARLAALGIRTYRLYEKISEAEGHDEHPGSWLAMVLSGIDRIADLLSIIENPSKLMGIISDRSLYPAMRIILSSSESITRETCFEDEFAQRVFNTMVQHPDELLQLHEHNINIRDYWRLADRYPELTYMKMVSLTCFDCLSVDDLARNERAIPIFCRYWYESGVAVMASGMSAADFIELCGNRLGEVLANAELFKRYREVTFQGTESYLELNADEIQPEIDRYNDIVERMCRALRINKQELTSRFSAGELKQIVKNRHLFRYDNDFFILDRLPSPSLAYTRRLVFQNLDVFKYMIMEIGVAPEGCSDRYIETALRHTWSYMLLASLGVTHNDLHKLGTEKRRALRKHAQVVVNLVEKLAIPFVDIAVLPKERLSAVLTDPRAAEAMSFLRPYFSYSPELLAKVCSYEEKLQGNAANTESVCTLSASHSGIFATRQQLSAVAAIKSVVENDQSVHEMDPEVEFDIDELSGIYADLKVESDGIDACISACYP